MRSLKILGAFALILLLGIGCTGGRAENIEPEVTVVETSGSVQTVVTRIVERISFITRTPDPAAPSSDISDPVELDLSLQGSLPDLDPARAESAAQLDLVQNLFIGLTNFNVGSNSIEPELATEWEVSPDGLNWTFRLRDDVYWVLPKRPRPGSNDLISVESLRPVTADDVVFAIERLCARDVESPLAFTLFLIEGCGDLYRKPEPTDEDRGAIGIRAPNDTTLEIRLTKPSAYFLSMTSMPLFQAVPRDRVTELGSQWRTQAGRVGTGWQTPDNLVTSGPYLPLTTTLTERNMVLHRNPLWPIDKTGNVDVINIYFFSEDDEAFEMWQSRGLDIGPLPSAERDNFLRRTPDKALLIPEPVLFYIGFDFGSTVFSEPEVRRAFSAAIDRQELIEQIYGGRGEPMRHATVPGIIASLPVGEVGVGYSPDYARQQMTASSFRSCRLLPPVTMMVSSADLSMRQAELIREMWIKELDCLKENIVLEQAQFGELLANTRPDSVNRPDFWELAWAPSFPDAHNFLNDLLHCTESENRPNRPCSEADTIQQQGSSTMDLAQRTVLYRQVESQFFGENGLFPIIPLYIRARFVVVHDWVDTYNPVTFGGQQWDKIILNPDLKELERSRS
ncbi:MAG: peptide ABC transporter substrate-binding protein [Chloroflexota bacterium]|jgi:oligopeptide transport system substrate-binding protein